jgi:hypothetical protein
MSEQNSWTPDEGSEADRWEQQVPARQEPDASDGAGNPDDVDDEIGPVGDLAAAEADVLEQAQPVPLEEETERG